MVAIARVRMRNKLSHLPHPSFVFLTSMEADIRVEKIGRCVVLRMERGENRMNPKFIEDMNQALDKAER